MPRIRVIAATLAAIAALTGTATAQDTANTPPTTGTTWERLTPTPAGPRARALQRMVTRYMRRQGYRVPTLGVYVPTDTTSWQNLMPPYTIAVALTPGVVISPGDATAIERNWPPTVDYVRALMHEAVHQLEDTPGGAYSRWDLTTRAIAEGRAQAAAEVLADRFMRRHFPRALYVVQFVSYPGCTELINLAVSRATRAHRGTRQHRSFLLALPRTPIREVVRVVTSNTTAAELQACRVDAHQPKHDGPVTGTP